MLGLFSLNLFSCKKITSLWPWPLCHTPLNCHYWDKCNINFKRYYWTGAYVYRKRKGQCSYKLCHAHSVQQDSHILVSLPVMDHTVKLCYTLKINFQAIMFCFWSEILMVTTTILDWSPTPDHYQTSVTVYQDRPFL